MLREYKLNDVVKLKKKHPCGEDSFKIVRVGVDIKIECIGCGRRITLNRPEFEKRARQVVIPADEV